MLKLSKGCKIEYFRERRDQGESSVAKTLTHAPWLYTHSTHWAVSTGRAACLPCSRCQSWGGGLSDKTRVPHTYEVHNKDVLNPSDLNASQGPPVSNKGWGQSQEWDWWTRSQSVTKSCNIPHALTGKFVHLTNTCYTSVVSQVICPLPVTPIWRIRSLACRNVCFHGEAW